jgi:hypothetical protein
VLLRPALRLARLKGEANDGFEDGIAQHMADISAFVAHSFRDEDKGGSGEAHHGLLDCRVVRLQRCQCEVEQ